MKSITVLIRVVGTQKAKECNVYASKDYIDFQKGLVEAETMFYKEMGLFELKKKTFDAEYISLKIDYELRRKGNL